MKKDGSGHEWVIMPGSNVSCVCTRCGVIGFYPAHTSRPQFETPITTFKGPCDLYMVSKVMKS